MSSAVLKAVAIGVLYVFASPIYLIGWIREFRRDLALKRLLDEGWAPCKTCGERNPLVGQETCQRCGFTEMGSRLYCSNCRKRVAWWLNCHSCRNSFTVP